MYIHIMTKMDDLFDDVAGRCAAVRTLGTARVITRHFDDALRPVGLTITQFTLLITIGRMKPESISEIGQWLNIDRTSLTRNLKPLEDAGYVIRGKEGPARKRKIDLTTAGAQILEKAYPLWQRAQGQVEARFPGDAYEEAKLALISLRSIGSD
ncbi:transcriptional regulator [Hyphomonas oceanitis SCH89]|uniref:Transcriptional regulator n=2 Tax=Hyphomonas oceanitis TaxID=81033 RepID=A0A059G991_9PROT|nr:transcriptional regulator [Hyphomonas oceanitis SCH89]